MRIVDAVAPNGNMDPIALPTDTILRRAARQTRGREGALMGENKDDESMKVKSVHT